MAIEIRERKNGKKYKAIVRFNGIKKSRTFDRKKDAEAWERSFLEARENSGQIPTITKDRISMKELYEIWFDKYAKFFQAPSTIRRERDLCNLYIFPFFGEIDVNKINRNHVQEFLNHLARNSRLKNITINRVRQVLQKMYNKAIEFEIIENNPVVHTKKFPEVDAYSTDFNYLSKQETKELLNFIKKRDDCLYSIVYALVSTGMRLGECLAIQVKDINLESNVPHIHVSKTTCKTSNKIRATTKGRKSRIIPMGINLTKYLEKLCEGKRVEEYVFFNAEKDVLKAVRHIQGKFSRAVKNCGVKRIRLHDLRHTFATQFLENGGNIYSLSKILGHSNTKITEKYSHFSDALKESAQMIMNF
jgi:integrase